MLNFVTINCYRFNAHYIVNVHEDDSKCANDDYSELMVFVNLANGREIILKCMDAVAFLTWWDSLAVDVHDWFSKNG